MENYRLGAFRAASSIPCGFFSTPSLSTFAAASCSCSRGAGIGAVSPGLRDLAPAASGSPPSRRISGSVEPPAVDHPACDRASGELLLRRLRRHITKGIHGAARRSILSASGHISRPRSGVIHCEACSSLKMPAATGVDWLARPGRRTRPGRAPPSTPGCG